MPAPECEPKISVMEKKAAVAEVKFTYLCPLLQVFDMPASLRFYIDILGFKIVQSSGEGYDVDWIWISRDEINLMLNTAYEKESRPAIPDPERIKSHYDTSIYLGCADIDALYDYLVPRVKKIQPPVITGYKFKALYLKDPDGYLLVFHWPLQG